MHLNAITGSNNSANFEVDFRLTIHNYELKEYGFP